MKSFAQTSHKSIKLIQIKHARHTMQILNRVKTVWKSQNQTVMEIVKLNLITTKTSVSVTVIFGQPEKLLYYPRKRWPIKMQVLYNQSSSRHPQLCSLVNLVCTQSRRRRHPMKDCRQRGHIWKSSVPLEASMCSETWWSHLLGPKQPIRCHWQHAHRLVMVLVNAITVQNKEKQQSLEPALRSSHGQEMQVT